MALDVGKLAIVTQAWQVFTYHASPAMFRSNTSSGVRNLENQEFENCVRALCDQGLAQLVVSYFLDALEVRPCLRHCAGTERYNAWFSFLIFELSSLSCTVHLEIANPSCAIVCVISSERQEMAFSGVIWCCTNCGCVIADCLVVCILKVLVPECSAIFELVCFYFMQ